ncbi:MAG: SusC/RagA family TonB-linked outer membrane protein [Janthinobacterium lividum]
MKKLVPPHGRLLIPMLACYLPLAVAASAPVAARAAELGQTARQPTAPITGRVTDTKGEGLPGVTVLVKGSTTGATTDANGNFTIDAPANATLVISSIGYTSQEIALAGRTIINVSLTDNEQALSEVVVMGYTTQDRQNLSSAVSSANVAEAKKAPVATITEAIQGRVTGVQINNSGNPGQNPNIVIRGLGSLNGGSAPLYVVDGLWTTSIRDLNPTDIESLNVLKDASSTAIYGSQGANGVIIITTRRGKAGKPTIGVNAYAGVQNTVSRWKLTNAAQWAAIERQAYANAGYGPNYHPEQIQASVLNPEKYADTDWQDAILQTGTVQDYSANLAGGSTGDKYSTNFLISGDAFKQKGALINTDFTRYTLRLNSGLTYGRFKINESVQLAHAFTTLANGQPFQDAVRLLPTIPVYDPTEKAGYGIGSPAANTFGTNPVASQNVETQTQYNNRIQGSVQAEYAFFDFLSYRLNVGVESLDYTDRHSRISGRISQNAPSDPSFLDERRGDNSFLLAENTLNFNKRFGDHGVNVVLGYSEQRNKNTYADAIARSFVSNTPGSQNNYLISQGTGTKDVFGEVFEWSKRSYFSQAVYDYKNRYLLTGSFRRDYSSRFDPAFRAANFGAGSVGWRISEEEFFKGLTPYVSNLKARFSYGVNGNDNLPNPYLYQGTINQNVNYPFGGVTVINGQIQTALPSTGIKWESRYTTDYGLDFGFLDNRITLSADYYVSTTKDALVNPALASYLGNYGGNPFSNIGNIQNKGFELQAAYQQTKGDFTYGVSANISTVKNQVLQLSQEGQVIGSGATQTAVGHPVGAFFLIPFDGVFQTQDEVNNYKSADGKVIQPYANAGDARYRDTNGDGQINDDDRIYYDTNIPKIQYGFSANAAYKGLDLSFLIQGSGGNQVFNVARATMDRTDDPSNFRADFQPWTPDNHSTTTPRALQSGGATGNLQAAAASNARGSSRFLESGSYARMKNITLGYTFSKDMMARTKAVSSLRIYVTAQNLFTITNYSGPDPEFVNGNFFERGVDYNAFPNLRTFIGGVQLGF